MPILSTLGAVFSNASLSFILALPLVIVSVVPVLFVATVSSSGRLAPRLCPQPLPRVLTCGPTRQVTKAIAGKGAAISFLSLCTAAIPWGPRGGLRTTDLARFDEVFKLPPGDHLPEHFRGVWFMEGNPQPDDLACLHNAQWDPVARRLTLYLTGEDGWTWHDSYDGRKKVFITALIGMNYVFEWDEVCVRFSFHFASIMGFLRIAVHIVVRIFSAVMPFLFCLISRAISRAISRYPQPHFFPRARARHWKIAKYSHTRSGSNFLSRHSGGWFAHALRTRR